MRLLVVEDESRTAEQLRRGLTESGCVADVVGSGDEGLHLGRTRSYDAILLDLGLPGRDGFEVLRQLRDADILIPVVCLTARDAVDDRVRALDLGADDYLIKPYSFAELLARLRAVLRRGGERPAPVIRVADLEVDLVARRASRGGRALDLRPKEFTLLAALARAEKAAATVATTVVTTSGRPIRLTTMVARNSGKIGRDELAKCRNKCQKQSWYVFRR